MQLIILEALTLVVMHQKDTFIILVLLSIDLIFCISTAAEWRHRPMSYWVSHNEGYQALVGWMSACVVDVNILTYKLCT